jgi:hypothetical protein
MPAKGVLDWSHPIALGIYAMRTPWGMEGRSFNATQTLAPRTPSTGGFGFGGPSTSTGDATDGFQTGPWTHAVWWTPGVATTQCLAVIAETPGSGTADRYLYTTTTGVYAGYIFDGSPKTVSATSGPVVGRADLVVLTCSGSSLDVWVNGVSEGTTATSNAGFSGFSSPELVYGWGGASPSNFTADTRLDSCVHFAGTWRRALSHNEIEALVTDPAQLFRF